MARTGKIYYATNSKVLAQLNKHPYFSTSVIKLNDGSASAVELNVEDLVFLYEYHSIDRLPFYKEFYKPYRSCIILPIDKLKYSGHQYEKLNLNFIRWIKFIAESTGSEITIETNLEKGDANCETITWRFNNKDNSHIKEYFNISHLDGERNEGELTLFANGEIYLNEYNTLYHSKEKRFETKRFSKSWNLNPSNKNFSALENFGSYIIKENNKTTLSDFLSEEKIKKLNDSNK